MSQKLILEAPKLSWQLCFAAASSVFKLLEVSCQLHFEASDLKMSFWEHQPFRIQNELLENEKLKLGSSFGKLHFGASGFWEAHFGEWNNISNLELPGTLMIIMIMKNH